MLPGNQYRFFSWVCKFSLLEALGKKQNETKTLNYEFIFCVTVGKGWTNAVKRILFWYHSEGSVSLQPRLTAVQQWGWPGWDACSLLGRPAPATAAACLCSSSARSAQCSQAHRWGFKWGQDPWKSAGKWNLANRQHPSVQPELRSRIQRIITTNWLWFGFIQHLVLIFKCLVLGTAPNLTLVLNCTACLGIFKENVNSCGLDSLLFFRLSACF